MSRGKLVKVKLLGELGRLFVREIELYCWDVRDAIRGLVVNFPDIETYFYESEQNNVSFRVIPDISNLNGIDETQLDYPIRDVLLIVPVVSGSGGLFRTILGAALLIGSFFMPATIGLFGLTIASTTVGLLGGSLLIGGIYQLLTPVPKLPETMSKAIPDAKRNRTGGRNFGSSGSKKIGDDVGGSFLFDRASEIGDQGLPVPVLYGERIIADPLVISSAIELDINLQLLSYNFDFFII